MPGFSFELVLGEVVVGERSYIYTVAYIQVCDFFSFRLYMFMYLDILRSLFGSTIW